MLILFAKDWPYNIIRVPAAAVDRMTTALSDTTLTRSQFISSRGNEYFCEIDEEYLTDRFNLTGLNTEVQYYQYALDLVTDVFDFDCDDDMREQIEKSARHLYGLVHARYIVTTRGLAKMVHLPCTSCIME
jgi:casein kinase II subunit beta